MEEEGGVRRKGAAGGGKEGWTNTEWDLTVMPNATRTHSHTHVHVCICTITDI